MSSAGSAVETFLSGNCNRMPERMASPMRLNLSVCSLGNAAMRYSMGGYRLSTQGFAFGR